MTVSQISDVITTVCAVALVLIVWFYTRNKDKIEKRAAEGDKMAKSYEVVERVVEPLVIQAEKDGGTGEEKFTQVLNSIFIILDLAHLPHPTIQYLKGMIEKGVTAMKKTQSVIDTIDGQKVADTVTDITKKAEK